MRDQRVPLWDFLALCSFSTFFFHWKCFWFSARTKRFASIEDNLRFFRHNAIFSGFLFFEIFCNENPFFGSWGSPHWTFFDRVKLVRVLMKESQKRPTVFWLCATSKKGLVKVHLPWSSFLVLLAFFLPKKSFEKSAFLFPVGETWFSSLMCIPSGIFRHCKIDNILTILSFKFLRHLVCLKFERDANLGCSRLVSNVHVNDYRLE